MEDLKYKYKLVRESDNLTTHTLYSDDDMSDPWSEGKKLPQGWGLEGNYRVEKEDMTSDNQKKKDKKTARDAAKNSLETMDLDNDDLRDIVKHVVNLLV